jgi:hypothetical protein
LPNKNAEKKDASIKLTVENGRMKNTCLQEAVMWSWLPSKMLNVQESEAKIEEDPEIMSQN